MITKKLLITTSLVFFSVSLNAQLMDYGFKLGIQSVRLQSFDDRTDFFDTEENFGFHFYGFSEWELVSFISTEIQLGYNLRGFSNSITFTDIDSPDVVGEGRARTKLHYLSATSFLKGNYRVQNLNLYSGIGPRFEYLLNSEAGKYNVESGRSSELYTSALEDETADLLDNSLFGLSVISGLRNVEMFSTNFSFELRYDLDLTDSMSQYPRDARNEAFVLSIGVGLK